MCHVSEKNADDNKYMCHLWTIYVSPVHPLTTPPYQPDEINQPGLSTSLNCLLPLPWRIAAELPIACCLLPVYCLLPIANCLLLTAYDHAAPCTWAKPVPWTRAEREDRRGDRGGRGLGEGEGRGSIECYPGGILEK